MRLSSAKWFLTVVLSATAFGLASTSNEASACCGFFRSLFGCCGGGCGYGAGYGPRMGTCGPSGCGTSYYGPVGWGRCSPCGPVCSPCGSGCSPCSAVACGACDSGNCSATAPSSMTPTPNDKWDPKTKTYAEPPAAGVTGTGDSEKQNQSQNGETGTSSTGSGTGTDAGSPASSQGGRKGPKPSKIDENNDNNGKGAGKAPTISIDEKVAWRSAPTRTRTETRTHVATTTRLVRLPAYPKTDWLPVDSESTVAARK